MSALLDQLVSPRPDLCFYGLAPPKLSTPPERVQAIVAAQKERLRALAPDTLVVYDLQEESARKTEPRPFPFLPTLAPDVYAHELIGDLTVPKIVYRSVASADRTSFGRWLQDMADAPPGGPRFSVLVGAPARSAMRPDALTLGEAYELVRRQAPALVLGGIAIAERHTRHDDEHERMLTKIAGGCRFFVTQEVYDAGSSKSLLSDYARTARARGVSIVPVVLTFVVSPVCRGRRGGVGGEEAGRPAVLESHSAGRPPRRGRRGARRSERSAPGHVRHGLPGVVPAVGSRST
jgi:hypothetical protein